MVLSQFIKIYQSQSALKKPEGVLNHSHTANSDAEGVIKNVEAVSVSVQERQLHILFKELHLLFDHDLQSKTMEATFKYFENLEINATLFFINLNFHTCVGPSLPTSQSKLAYRPIQFRFVIW